MLMKMIFFFVEKLLLLTNIIQKYIVSRLFLIRWIIRMDRHVSRNTKLNVSSVFYLLQLYIIELAFIFHQKSTINQQSKDAMSIRISRTKHG